MWSPTLLTTGKRKKKKKVSETPMVLETTEHIKCSKRDSDALYIARGGAKNFCFFWGGSCGTNIFITTIPNTQICIHTFFIIIYTHIYTHTFYLISYIYICIHTHTHQKKKSSTKKKSLVFSIKIMFDSDLS